MWKGFQRIGEQKLAYYFLESVKNVKTLSATSPFGENSRINPKKKGKLNFDEKIESNSWYVNVISIFQYFHISIGAPDTV